MPRKRRRGWNAFRRAGPHHPRPSTPPVQHPAPAGVRPSQARRERAQAAVFAAAVQREHERLERIDAETARLIARDANAPMTSAPVWHVHDGRDR